MYVYKDLREALARERLLAKAEERHRILRILRWMADLECERGDAERAQAQPTRWQRLQASLKNKNLRPMSEIADSRCAVLKEAIGTIREKSEPLPSWEERREARLLMDGCEGEKTMFIVLPKPDGGFEYFPGVQPEVSEEMGLTQAYSTNLKQVIAREQHDANMLSRAAEWTWRKLNDWDTVLMSQVANQSAALNAITTQAISNMTGLANALSYTASEKLMESAGAIASEQIERAISLQPTPDALATVVALKVVEKLEQ